MPSPLGEGGCGPDHSRMRGGLAGVTRERVAAVNFSLISRCGGSFPPWGKPRIYMERNIPMKEIILAYQGEMTLKGLNRAKFEARLAKIIRWRLEPLGKFKVYQAQSTVFIEPKEDGLDMDEAFRRVSHVFGIVKLSRAVECPKDFDAVCETAEALPI